MLFSKKSSSPYINRFLQPDTIIPNLSNPQSWNRYSYVLNSPVNHTDPTGHYCVETDGNGDPIRVDCETGDNNDNPVDELTSDGGRDPDEELDLTLPDPSELPCGGYLTCPQSAEDFFYSYFPFTSSDLCRSFHQNPALCDWRSWNYPYISWHSNLGVRGPDYITFNIAIPSPLLILGPDFQVIQDRNNNWYVSGGGYLGAPGVSAMGGWILQREEPSEDVVENFFTGSSFFGSGGAGMGGGVTWGHPGSYGWNNFAVEGGVTSPGGALGLTKGYLLYDSGDPTPWIWQGD